MRGAIERACARLAIAPRFALLSGALEPRGYRLYVETREELDPGRIRALERDLQELLCENPHYRYACGLRQLEPVRVRMLATSGWSIFERVAVEHGCKPGDVKPTAITSAPRWSVAFERHVLGHARSAAHAADEA